MTQKTQAYTLIIQGKMGFWLLPDYQWGQVILTDEYWDSLKINWTHKKGPDK